MNLYIITGQTATGKTGLSLDIAEQCNAEIISADSRQVYKGLDYSSNKITESEMRSIPHYGLNIAEIGQRFTVSDFQQYAREKILEIFSRGKNVVLVGGTGLYIDAVMFDHYTFGGRRASLPFTDWQIWQPFQSHHVIWIGLVARPDTLLARIQSRAHAHHSRVLSELSSLITPQNRDWLHSLGLESRYGIDELEGTINADQYIKQLVLNTRRYAKRQMTWFKRNKNIHWYIIPDISHSEIISDIVK